MGREKRNIFKTYILIVFLLFGCSAKKEEDLELIKVYKVKALRVDGQDEWSFVFSGDRQIKFVLKKNKDEEDVTNFFNESSKGDLGQFSISLYDFTRNETLFDSCHGEMVGSFEVLSVEEESVEVDSGYNIFDPYIDTEENTVDQEYRYELSLEINGKYDLSNGCPTYPNEHHVSIVQLDNKDIVYIDFTVGLQYYMELKNKEEI